MACLRVRSARGVRLIPEGSDGNVRGRLPDEVIMGVVWDCGPRAGENVLTPEGLMVGNLVKKVATALGIKQCFRCKRRQQRWNAAGLKLQQKLGLK